jgi:hypothetical protein
MLNVSEIGYGNGLRWLADYAQRVKRHPELDPWRHEELASLFGVTGHALDSWASGAALTRPARRFSRSR